MMVTRMNLFISSINSFVASLVGVGTENDNEVTFFHESHIANHK